MKQPDFLVIGGGVIGICIGRELKRRFKDCRVTLIEKEDDVGQHASGRNSGVLHAGFYYTPDSLKARFTRDGNRALSEYCNARKIGVNRCGKLVVASSEGEHAQLDELLVRGRKNGIEMHEVTETEAKSIEPRARTAGRAIFSPTTASVDPVQVVQAMKNDALAEGVEMRFGARFIGRTADGVLTSTGRIDAGYVVNAAGLYADRIARQYGFSQSYRILPFKGLYLYSNEPPGAIRTNIYPVPDLRNPFLGVHFTVAANGAIKIGPTAIPAFWREHYRGLENFRAAEMTDIIWRQVRLFWSSGFDFRRLALEEFMKYSRRRMVSLAQTLARGVTETQFRRWGTPGIRAQLMNIVNNKLEMDFVIEGDDRSLHVLNAVSPAFTCAIPFASYVTERVSLALGGSAAGERRFVRQ